MIYTDMKNLKIANRVINYNNVDWAEKFVRTPLESDDRDIKELSYIEMHFSNGNILFFNGEDGVKLWDWYTRETDIDLG
jgi:hypothetical protein